MSEEPPAQARATEGQPAGPPAIEGLGALVHRYDAFIVDLWGVLHDGVQPYVDALLCLEELKRRGSRVLILSNAPRRAAEVARRTAALGIGPALYQGIMSSGEEAWQCLHRRADPWYRALGRRVLCLMAAGDRAMLDGLDLAEADAVLGADFVLALGVESAHDRVADFESVLADAAGRQLPMVCANPDLEVVRGGAREICAGALARRFEELGGRVRYHGKPHASIYETCFALLGRPARGRVLAIGDSLSTDIAGAAGVGIDSLWVTGGIHAEELGGGAGEAHPRRLAEACRRAGVRPTAAIGALRWG